MSKYHRFLLLTIVLVIAAAIVIWQMPLRKGLDLAGGMRVVLQAQAKDLRDDKGVPLAPEKKSEKMNAVIKTLKTRVGGINGVAEPTVSRQGDDRVLVELPGVKDKAKALSQLKDTAKLEFYYLRDVQSERNPAGKWKMYPPQADPKTGEDIYYFENMTTHETIKGDTLKGQQEILDKVINAFRSPDPKTGDPGNPEGQKAFLTGDDLKPNAQGDFENGTVPVIRIEFNQKGADKFRDFTTRHVGEYTAILLGGKIITAPTIKVPIVDGKAIIERFPSLQDAEQRAQLLNSGALPVGLDIVQLDDVEATLGKEVVNLALIAGLVGLALVLLFMLVVYRLPGLLADLALGIYALLTYAVFTAVGVTMTLPGIAAFILSIGMAVDANILIFERLKEELRSGKTLHAAIDAGFSRAFTAIFDSNMCTAITAIILMKLGTGSVQSFAFTLLIGVAISMFTAITVTRTFLHLLVSMEWAQKPSLFGIGEHWITKSNINVVGRRNFFFALSALVIIPGVVFYFLNMGSFGSGLKPGIEFKPGTSMQVTFQHATITAKFAKPIDTISTGEISDLVRAADVKGTEIPNTVKVAGDTATIDAALGQKDAVQIVEIKDVLNSRIKSAPVTDFTVKYEQPSQQVLASDVEKLVESTGVKNNAQISTSGGAITAFIRTDEMKNIPDGVKAITDALENKYGMAKVSTSSVGPTISKELTQNAILAVILAMAAIVLYLAFRFAIGGFVDGLKYGVCAVTATFHDVLVITGLFAIAGHFLGWEIDTLFVTAVLTMIGFSTHDTIVVFDRIRENLKHRLRGEDYEALANRSILQTFTRSINTSFTVLLTILALTLFGGGGLSIKHMYYALLVGIISGTYSSIFNATPLLVVWENISNRRKAGAGQKKAADDKVFVARNMKPVAETSAEPTNGTNEETDEDLTSSGDADRTKVKPKRRKRRY